MAREPDLTDISPDTSLETCARRIIVNFFREMMSYKAGVKAGADTASVHDMRVTSRRLRTAMDNFADCFSSEPFKRHYKKVKAITRALGAVRDMDVLMARFQAELPTLTETEQAEVQCLIAALEQERAAARAPMLALFAELEAARFDAEFLAFFQE